MPRNPAPRIENHLAAIMAERRMTAADVARACGLSRLTVYNLRDNSCAAFTSETLLRLCEGLGVGVGALITYTED